MEKYIIRKYQVIYSNGSRDKVNLEIPICTCDKEAVRGKLKIKHSGHGITCVGVNLDYDELNEEDL